MNTQTATEYRHLPLSVLTESKTNPRRIFEDDALRELAESIRTSGVVQPLLVRPITEQDFEVVVGARRFRASKLAEKQDAPCRIANLTDAEVLEIQLVELSIVVKRFLSVFAGLHVVDMSTTCGFAS